MLRQVDWHRVRVGLAVALIIIFAGVVIDSLFSASWALDDGLLLAAAAVIARRQAERPGGATRPG